MRAIVLSFLLFTAFSCGDKKMISETTSTSAVETKQDYIIRFPSDTINYTDQYNRKQGFWIDQQTKERYVYQNDTAYPVTTDSSILAVINMLNKK